MEEDEDGGEVGEVAEEAEYVHRGRVRVGEWKTGDCRYSIAAPDV